METAEFKTMTRLECPECKAAGREWVAQHEAAVVARRALSLHRFKEHGIRSEKAIKEAERKERLKASGGVPAPRAPTRKTLEDLGPCPPLSESQARSNWMKTRWRILHPKLVEAQRQRHAQARREKRAGLTPVEAAHRDQLQESSWWRVQDKIQEVQEIKLSQCPCCGAQFRAIKPTQ